MRRRLVISLVLTGFGLLLVVVQASATEVECTLQADESYTCQLRTLLLGEMPIFERHIERILGITMEDDGCDEAGFYRAEFVTANGQQVPLYRTCTNEGLVVQQVTTLRAQMERHVERINYTIEVTWWFIWCMGGMIVLGLLLSPLYIRYWQERGT